MSPSSHRRHGSLPTWRKLMKATARAVAFRIVQVVLPPLGIVGYVLFAFRTIAYSRRTGSSATVADLFLHEVHAAQTWDETGPAVCAIDAGNAEHPSSWIALVDCAYAGGAPPHGPCAEALSLSL